MVNLLFRNKRIPNSSSLEEFRSAYAFLRMRVPRDTSPDQEIQAYIYMYEFAAALRSSVYVVAVSALLYVAAIILISGNHDSFLANVWFLQNVPLAHVLANPWGVPPIDGASHNTTNVALVASLSVVWGLWIIYRFASAFVYPNKYDGPTFFRFSALMLFVAVLFNAYDVFGGKSDGKFSESQSLFSPYWQLKLVMLCFMFWMCGLFLVFLSGALRKWMRTVQSR